MSDVSFILVMQDGTTYGGLEGCRIVAVPATLDHDQTEEYLTEVPTEDQWSVDLHEDDGGIWIEYPFLPESSSRVNQVIQGRPPLEAIPALPE